MFNLFKPKKESRVFFAYGKKLQAENKAFWATYNAQYGANV